jgi:hypothetical protein
MASTSPQLQAAGRRWTIGGRTGSTGLAGLTGRTGLIERAQVV